jgi:CHASE3 domain sensor protein
MKGKKLPNDLIERFIRIEQRVSAHFGSPVSYKKTEYFKSLTNEEKKDFENYLKKNKKKKFILITFLIFMSLLALVFTIRFTGGAIGQSMDAGSTLLGGFLFVVLIVVLIYVFVSFVNSRNREKRFNYHLGPLEHALVKGKHFKK